VALLFDFRCEDDHMTERFVSTDTLDIPCSVCGKLSKKVLTPPRIKLCPIYGDSPAATRKWEKNRAQKLALERKANS